MQQQRVRDALGFISRHPRILRSMPLNTFIHDAGVLQAQALSTEQIVAAIRNGIGSRRHNPGLTPLETLTDILVHSQDIAIPLDLDLPMRPALSALAATRRWDTRNTWLATVNRQLPLDPYQLRATDTDWSRGQGPDVTGPIGAILLLLTGRTAALDQLAGHGADALRAALDQDRREPTTAARPQSQPEWSRRLDGRRPLSRPTPEPSRPRGPGPPAPDGRVSRPCRSARCSTAMRPGVRRSGSVFSATTAGRRMPTWPEPPCRIVARSAPPPRRVDQVDLATAPGARSGTIPLLRIAQVRA